MFIHVCYGFIAWVFTDTQTHTVKKKKIFIVMPNLSKHIRNITIKFTLYINFILSNYYTGYSVTIHTY